MFQVFIKWLIGGLRPHFLAICNPQLPVSGQGQGFDGLYHTREIVSAIFKPSTPLFLTYHSQCTGDKKAVNDALESMPSGHSTAAFAGLVFLSLYFNAQLKLLSSHNPAYVQVVCRLVRSLTALSE